MKGTDKEACEQQWTRKRLRVKGKHYNLPGQSFNFGTMKRMLPFSVAFWAPSGSLGLTEVLSELCWASDSVGCQWSFQGPAWREGHFTPALYYDLSVLQSDLRQFQPAHPVERLGTSTAIPTLLSPNGSCLWAFLTMSVLRLFEMPCWGNTWDLLGLS